MRACPTTAEPRRLEGAGTRGLGAFEAEHGASDCRTLIGYDLQAPGEYKAFIENGFWREACASQIRTVVVHLAELDDDEAWETAVRRTEARPSD